MKSDGTLCRALNGHAWEISGGIVVLKDNARRILFHCSRCDSYRTDVWGLRGNMLRRGYQRAKEYDSFLKTTDRPGARALILAAVKEVPHGSGKGTQVRSLPKRRVRRGHVEPAQRARKKRRLFA